MGDAIWAGAARLGMLALSQLSVSKIVYKPTHDKLTNGGKVLIDLNHDGVIPIRSSDRSKQWRSNPSASLVSDAPHASR
jgi:hypothetical protein